MNEESCSCESERGPGERRRRSFEAENERGKERKRAGRLSGSLVTDVSSKPGPLSSR